MAHIVCIVGPFAGLLYASCELLLRLEADGHQVTLVGPEDIRETVTRQGLTFSPLPADTIKETAEADRKRTRWSCLLAIPQRRREALAALGVDTFPDTLRELKPDLVLCDIEMHQHVMSAVSTGIPVALLIPWMSIWKRPGLPPLHKTTQPGQGWKGTPLGNEVVWMRFRLWKCKIRWKERIKHLGADRVSVLKLLASTTGFPFRREVQFHHWLAPFSYRSLPVLALRARELDFPHDPPPQVQYVGPMIDVSRRKQPLDSDAGRLAAVFRRCEAEEDRKLIYCGLSTMRASDYERDYLERVIAAVTQRPHWDLVLGLGGNIEPDSLGDLPPNIHAFSWAPQLHILRHADAALMHGGINGLDECILCGVPMLVHSLGWTDMPGCAARVAFHGLGISGDRKNDAPGKILADLEEILTNPDFRSRVAKMRTDYERYAEEHRAEKAVKALLKRAAGEH